MARHYAKNLRPQLKAGSVVITFDCSCGMTDDRTVGATVREARARVDRICREHGATVASHVSRAIR